jgi:thioredoxin:protein disulfide reductase
MRASRIGSHCLIVVCWLMVGVLTSLLARSAIAEEPQFLEDTDAFKMSAEVIDAQTVVLNFTVAEGYYLYKDKFKFTTDPVVSNIEPEFPAAQRKVDAQFGETSIYRQQLRLPVRLHGAAGAVTISVKTQGCADAGLCYPPFTRTATLMLSGGGQAVGQKAMDQKVIDLTAGAAMTSVAPAATAVPPAPIDESSRITAMLGQQGLPIILASFFGFGLLLALTPCVFPMIPILSGIIVGSGKTLSKKRSFTLSLVYVLGMAVTYALAGVAAGLSGTLLSAALQNAWVLSAFAGVFVLLSLSMFGFYELQLPASLQTRLSLSADRQGGSMAGVAIMGSLSALIVGPCVAAPLAGALLYIAKTGNAWLGGAALFVMALGMGVPLLLVGMAAGSLMPRAGGWMEGVKKVFGVILLLVALWLVSPVLPAAALMLALATMLIFIGVYLHAFDHLPLDASGWLRFRKGLGIVSSVVGIALLIGQLAGSRDPLQPLAVVRGVVADAVADTTAVPHFERVKNLVALEQRLATATKPVLLDFYADWCVSCKEMEKFTFADGAVSKHLEAFELLQVNVTASNDADKALLKKFALFGPPAIVFFAPGTAAEVGRVIGFQDANKFTQTLQSIGRDPATTLPTALAAEGRNIKPGIEKMF